MTASISAPSISFGALLRLAWPIVVSRSTQVAIGLADALMVAHLGESALAAAVLVSPWWALAMPLLGYGPAWIGHFGFERNRPATFKYPLWSLRGDFRMYRLMWLGRMGPEVERARALHPPA